MTRGVLLTGLSLSLIFFAFALFILNPLRDKDLEQARKIEGQLRRRMTAPLPESSRGPRDAGPDALENALASQAAVLEVDPSTVYESAEARAFEIAQLERQLPGATGAARLAPPQRLRPVYTNGSVDVAWSPGLPNIELAKALRAAPGEELAIAYRVYRALGGAPPELIATVAFGTESYRDRDMPLAASSIAYEVWAVLLRSGDEEPVLVAAERSDRVTVATPEHFTLSLLSGDAEHADLRIAVTAGDREGAVTRLSASPGDELVVDQTSLGLTLTSLEVVEEARLEQRERLVLTSDASLVLEPGTRRPQTMQTPVLMNVTQLRVTLVDRAGESRILEVDLP